MDGKLERLGAGHYSINVGCLREGDIVTFSDGHTIMLGSDGLYFMGMDMAAMPDDAAPIPVSAIDITSPGIVNGETHYERKKRYDEELLEKNRRNREEIKRILGQ